jgi:hypothetical protein
MIRLIFFIMISTVNLFAQIIYEDEQIFNFYDEFNNSQEVIIGKNPWASDGLDPTLGEEVIAQVPLGQFGVRFQLPPDTSIYTIKDIRFGCYWATGFYHLIDLSYSSGSSAITVNWTWGSGELGELESVAFYNPYTGELLELYSWSQYTEYFVIPFQLDKIQLSPGYGGTLSVEDYEIYTPNGGEIIEGGSIYNITYNSFEFGPGLNIEFSSDSGQTWELIVENHWSPSPYEWLVPILSSEKCLIRLGDYPCVYDISDSTFIITYPVSIKDEKILPTEFSLEQNFPNPFNPSTTIYYSIPELSSITLKVYDVLGKELVTLVNEEKPAGSYEVEFTGDGLTSGIYFYQFRADNYVETKKMILLK